MFTSSKLQTLSVITVQITVKHPAENLCTHGPVNHYWQLYLVSVIRQDFVKITLY